MAEVYKFGKMDQDMMDFGRTARHMVRVVLFTQKVTYTRVNGAKTKLTVLEFNKTIKVAAMKETGRTINKMVKELRNGQMVQFTKANIKME
jgi:hypothetical protein